MYRAENVTFPVFELLGLCFGIQARCSCNALAVMFNVL